MNVVVRKLGIVVLGFGLGLGVARVSEAETTETTVWICQGPHSKRYHFTDTCRGLSKCSTPVVKVALTKAKKMGRTLCGWED